MELPTANHNDLPRGSEQFPTSPIQEVPSQERNQASSVSLHCITTWSWFPCIHVLYGTSIGGQPIAVKKGMLNGTFPWPGKVSRYRRQLSRDLQID